MFCRATWGRGDGWGGGGGVERQSRQTDTKSLCVNAVALRLMISNTKIICNLSDVQGQFHQPYHPFWVSVVGILPGMMC